MAAIRPHHPPRYATLRPAPHGLSDDFTPRKDFLCSLTLDKKSAAIAEYSPSPSALPGSHRRSPKRILHYSQYTIDIARNTFQVYGVDDRGNQQVIKRLSRNKLYEYTVNLPICTIVMGSCGGAHHLGRRFERYVHKVKLIAAQFVKPFRTGYKTDSNDAKAIPEKAIGSFRKSQPRADREMFSIG